MRALLCLALSLALSFPIAHAEEAPVKVLKTIFESGFDSKELGHAPGVMVNSTFDTDKVGTVLDKQVLSCDFESGPSQQALVIATTSFEQGISPEVFQWGEDSPFSIVAQARSGKAAVSVETTGALLSTHEVASEPGRWHEVSVWHKGEGRVKLRVFDGVGWSESVSPEGAEDWRLMRMTFLAKEPKPKKTGKITVRPAPALAVAFGLHAEGNALFDDLGIVRLPRPEMKAGALDGAAMWLAHVREMGLGLGRSKAIRVRNGRTLASKLIPVEPGKQYVVRFHYRGLGSIPALPHRVTKSACAGRFYIDAQVDDGAPRCWGYATNLLLDQLGTEDGQWKLVLVHVSVPAKLWKLEPKAIGLRFSSSVSARSGFDYDQFGDVLIDDLAIAEGRSGTIDEGAGDEFWLLPDPRRATTLGRAGRVEVVEKAGLRGTRAVKLGDRAELTAHPLTVAPPQFLDISCYYRGLRSSANRPELSAGTTGCGRVWTTYEYDSKALRDTGAWAPLSLTQPEQPDKEWTYARLWQYVAPGRKGQDPEKLIIRAAPAVLQNFWMYGEVLLDNFAVRRLSMMEPGAAGDSLWLGVPDPTLAEFANANDCRLQIAEKAGVRKTKAIRIDGKYIINTISVPIETGKKYLLSLQYKVLADKEWRGVGRVGGYLEVYWGDAGALNERVSITYLKPEEGGSPDKDWRMQTVAFTVPAQTRSKAVPTAIRIHLGGHGTILFDNVKLDQVE